MHRPKKNEDPLFAESINPLISRAVEAVEKDVSSDVSKEEKNEDQLFREMIGVQLSKIADGEQKNDTKMDNLTPVNQIERKMREIHVNASL